MGKKRFQKTRIVDKWGGIYDSETDRILDVNDVEHKLNEQQATITHLEKVNGKNFAKRRLLEKDNLVLRNENEQLRQLVEEYRKTNKHLCELCANASKNGYLPPLEDLR